jgi:hypothetical protein
LTERPSPMLKHLLMAVPAAAASAATPVYAGDMQVQLEIPRLRVAEYHKPYVAVWIENEAGKTVATLDAWYQTDAKAEDGRKWLPDLRTWWRRAGRAASMPANGIAGPLFHAIQGRHASAAEPDRRGLHLAGGGGA